MKIILASAKKGWRIMPDKKPKAIEVPRNIRQDLEFLTCPTILSQVLEELSIYFYEKARNEKNYRVYELSGVFKNAMIAFDAAVYNSKDILSEGKYGIETD